MKRGIVNLVCGVIGIGLLSAFLIGLAISIGDIAFGIVVAVVLLPILCPMIALLYLVVRCDGGSGFLDKSGLVRMARHSSAGNCEP